MTQPQAARSKAPPSVRPAAAGSAAQAVAHDGDAPAAPDEARARRDTVFRPHIRVMTTGVFDILHPGHVHMLEEAKKLGDELVVVIARDESVAKEKHQPITPEEHRRHMVEALKPVDKAVLGHRGDYYLIVQELQPNIFALGFDQKYDEADVQAEFDRRGVDCKVVRLPKFVGDLVGSRRIVEKVAQRLAEQSMYPEEAGGTT